MKNLAVLFVSCALLPRIARGQDKITGATPYPLFAHGRDCFILFVSILEYSLESPGQAGGAKDHLHLPLKFQRLRQVFRHQILVIRP